MEYKDVRVVVIPEIVRLDLDKLVVKASTSIEISANLREVLPNFYIENKLKGMITFSHVEDVAEVESFTKEGTLVKLSVSSKVFEKRGEVNEVSLKVIRPKLVFKPEGDFELFGAIRRVKGGFLAELGRLEVNIKDLKIDFSNDVQVVSDEVKEFVLEPLMTDRVLSVGKKKMVVCGSRYVDIPVKDSFGNIGTLRFYTNSVNWIESATTLTLHSEDFEYKIEGDFLLVPDISRVDVCPPATLTLRATASVFNRDIGVCVDGNKVFEGGLILASKDVKGKVSSDGLMLSNLVNVGKYESFDITQIFSSDIVLPVRYKTTHDLRLTVLPNVEGYELYLDLGTFESFESTVTIENIYLVQDGKVLRFEKMATDSVIEDIFGNDARIVSLGASLTETASSGFSSISYQPGKVLLENFSKPGDYTLETKALVSMESFGLSFKEIMPLYITVEIASPTVEATATTRESTAVEFNETTAATTSIYTEPATSMEKK